MNAQGCKRAASQKSYLAYVNILDFSPKLALQPQACPHAVGLSNIRGSPKAGLMRTRTAAQ